MVCSICNSDLVSETRVCKTCGHPVSDNPTLEDIYFSRLAANAPPMLVRKVRTAPYLEKERRTVTAIMFTIADSNTFIQHIPEDKRNPLINQALDRFSKIIFDYEGTIAKLWENTVLAFFGAPVTHEDDPLRAVYAAAAILEEVQKYSSEIEESYHVPLKLKMVVNTGPVLIGDIKSNLRFSFQSLNNTLECIDTAIHAAIPPCKIVLCEDTYQFVKPFIECTKLGEISLTDINQTNHLLQVDRFINQTHTPLRISLSQHSPLIGRQIELDLLLELSETVFAGLGRVGLILGEPGIGKSRLILEWKRKIKTLHQPSPVRWIEAHGLAFGRELAYHLMKDLLRATLEIPATAPMDIVKQILHLSLIHISEPTRPY